MTLAEKKAEIVEAFSLYEEWLDKYEYLIELGKDLPPYPEEKKTEDRLIKGCQSRVWLDAELRDGRLYFTADSDAIITKGIISLLIDVYSGRTPLSPTRANGLVSMIETIRQMARDSEVLRAEDVAALQPYYTAVIAALKEVYDPEIPVNIYDLGLIYELTISKAHEVFILMTFTAPNCPMADQVLAEVRESVEAVPGITKCTIEMTFEPAWDKSMLSEEARLELGLDYDEDDYGKLDA